jgi:hypothetical protein
MLFSDVKKSFSNILEERISSPFYGSFILSWIIWNWKPIYATFFVSKNEIKVKTKLDYILSFYYDCWYCNLLPLIFYPLISTLVLILLIPRLSNWLFKESLKYEKERIELREEQTASQRLTHEQSVQIRNEKNTLIEAHNKDIQNKIFEIEAYKNQLKDLQEDLNSFDVLHASYGSHTKFIDVTSIVKNLLRQSPPSFTIDIDNLKSDPAPGKYKVLQIVYKYQKNVYSLIGNEYQNIEYDSVNAKLITIDTPKSVEIYNRTIDDKVYNSIEVLFPGTWNLEYSGKISGTEKVQIFQGNKYLASVKDEPFVHYFNLEHIQISLENEEISFIKNSVIGEKRKVISNLKIIEIGKHYQGHEQNGEIIVSYVRID